MDAPTLYGEKSRAHTYQPWQSHLPVASSSLLFPLLLWRSRRRESNRAEMQRAYGGAELQRACGGADLTVRRRGSNRACGSADLTVRGSKSAGEDLTLGK